MRFSAVSLLLVALRAWPSPISASNDTPPPAPVAVRGTRVCAQCHAAQANPQPTTSMAHAMETVAECVTLREHSLLTFKDGIYSYSIQRQGDSSIYSVSDGKDTLSAPIGWAFGLGMAGQTYVYQYNGDYYESRLSFYKELNGLDLTMGASRAKPRTIVEALGRRMSSREDVECFGCHSTAAVAENKLQANSLIAGVQCEHCHGSTADHLQAFKTGNMQNAVMKDLRKMNSEEVNDFCGQCHRTWAQIASNGPAGIANIRFQPYRITNSKCYDADDRRISCVACHDPHKNLQRNNTIAYDGKCLACHGSAADAKGRACPVGKQDCAGCHMPRLSMPGSHHAFVDHEIRIVRTGEKYPN